jgi:hypothetical protein
MLEIIEDYCKVCGDTYDPLFGCRCDVTRAFGLLVSDEVMSADSATYVTESRGCSKLMRKKSLRTL